MQTSRFTHEVDLDTLLRQHLRHPRVDDPRSTRPHVLRLIGTHHVHIDDSEHSLEEVGIPSYVGAGRSLPGR